MAVAVAPVPGTDAPRGPHFFQLIPRAFLYPFTGTGWLLLLIGAAFFWSLALAARMMFGIVVALFAGGYLAAYMIRIVGSTANGEDELPTWPSVGDFWEDILLPFFLVTGTFVACFAPAFLLSVVSAWKGWRLFPAVVSLGVAGAVYYPMALMAVAVIESLEALRPTRVLPAILKVLPDYLLTGLVFAALVVYRVLSGLLFAHVAYGGSLLAGLTSFYILIVQMRLLGLLYRTHERRLNWFPELTDA